MKAMVLEEKILMEEFGEDHFSAAELEDSNLWQGVDLWFEEWEGGAL